MTNNFNLQSYLLEGSIFKSSKPLKEEDSLAYALRTYLTQETLENRLPYVWFHVANEVSNAKQFVFGAKLKALGKLPGVADFIFLGNGKCAALELKTGTGKLSKNQKIFMNWCQQNKVKYGIARTLADAIKFIKEI